MRLLPIKLWRRPRSSFLLRSLDRKRKKKPQDKEKLKSVAHASKKSKFVPPMGYENPKPRHSCKNWPRANEISVVPG